MRVAPIGAFGAMAFTIGRFGIGSLLSLGKLMGTFYLTCLLFVSSCSARSRWYHGFSIFKFIRYIKEELLIVLGTSSSESVLPRMMAKMENLGVTKSTVGLVIPAGYSFNLDGTSIYLTMAAVFIAQATNTPMTLVPGADAARRADADVEGRVRRDRQRLHRARGDARGGRPRPGRGPRADPRHRPLHVGGARADEPRSATASRPSSSASGAASSTSARMSRVLNRETDVEADEPERVLDSDHRATRTRTP